MTTTERPTLPTLAEVRDQRPTLRVDLDSLPPDPEGWCSFEIAEGGWSHTTLCEHGVSNGGPRLCEMWAERDRRDAAHRRRLSVYEQQQIAEAEDRTVWPYSGGYDPHMQSRRAEVWRGMGVEDDVWGRSL